jgi:RNA recognition motif-containing protein
LVENLDESVGPDELMSVFAKYSATISVLIVVDRKTGRSCGFGFVEMEDGGDRAITEIDGMELQGRNLRVTEAGERYHELMRAHDYYFE